MNYLVDPYEDYGNSTLGERYYANAGILNNSSTGSDTRHFIGEHILQGAYSYMANLPEFRQFEKVVQRELKLKEEYISNLENELRVYQNKLDELAADPAIIQEKRDLIKAANSALNQVYEIKQALEAYGLTYDKESQEIKHA